METKVDGDLERNKARPNKIISNPVILLSYRALLVFKSLHL